MLRPFAIVAMTRAPRSAPRTSPRPPKRLTPPITAAEIASSRSVPPPWFRFTDWSRAARTMPPTPAMTDEITKTMIRTRGTLMPRRLGVPADGVHVTTERGALREVREADEEDHHDECGEREAERPEAALGER